MAKYTIRYQQDRTSYYPYQAVATIDGETIVRVSNKDYQEARDALIDFLKHSQKISKPIPDTEEVEVPDAK